MMFAQPVGNSALFIMLLLVVAILVSGFATVYSRHEARKHFAELQGLYSERDELQVEWGQLLLEQGTAATPGRIEQLAREKLNMRLPEPAGIIMLEATP